MYRCLRSTSQLEGYHLHLRLLLCACALSAGARLQDNLVKAFQFHWFVRALRARGLYPTWVRHTQLDLYDLVHKLSADLVNAGRLKKNWSPGWVPLPTGAPILRQGIVYALEVAGDQLNDAIGAAAPADAAAAAALVPAPLPRRPTNLEWLQHFARAQMRGEYTAEDVAAILTGATIKTTSDMQNAAARRGIALSASQAEAWNEKVYDDVAALNELKKRGIYTVQRQQRQTVPPPAGPALDFKLDDLSAAAAVAASVGGRAVNLAGSHVAPFAGPVHVDSLAAAAAMPPPAAPAAAAPAAEGDVGGQIEMEDDVGAAAAAAPAAGAAAAAAAGAAAVDDAAKRKREAAAARQRKRRAKPGVSDARNETRRAQRASRAAAAARK